MRTGLLRTIALWSATLGVGMVLGGLANAATDIREFIHDTQQTANQAQQVTMVWWIPPEFWDVSLAANPSVPADTVAQIHAALHDYQVFAVVRASAGIQGLTDLQSKADLISNSRFEVAGKPIAQVPPDQVPLPVQSMLGTLKPMLSTMLGQLGKSMELEVYPGVVDEQRLIDPLKAGAFDFSLYEQTFHWRTPLASLLPKKVDRKTHEEFPGNFLFNPFTGDKLPK